MKNSPHRGYLPIDGLAAYDKEVQRLVFEKEDKNIVTVQAVAPDGIVNVPGLEALQLPANGLITVDLTDAAAVDRQLIVRSTSRIFVERQLPRDVGALGRVASWPLPAAG